MTTPEVSRFAPGVQTALAELRARFSKLSAESDGGGGAFVILESVPLGPPFTHADTWVGFHITNTCPYADVYPHYLRDDLAFIDGRQLQSPLNAGQHFPPAAVDVHQPPRRLAVMVSRRSNKRDNGSTLETPLLKLLKVLECLRSM